MNDLVYSSASESRTRDKITRRYTLDDQLRTRGHAECSILRDANTADFSILIDGATAMQWQCVNLINDSEQYQCLICFRGQYEGKIELTINKSKPGEVCLIPQLETILGNSKSRPKIGFIMLQSRFQRGGTELFSRRRLLYR